MNLNEIRILEACHKFLIGLTDFKDELQDDSLVYRFQGEEISFVTYQKCEDFMFIDYDLQFDFLRDNPTYIDDLEELINAFPSQHQLKVLNKMSDLEQVRMQIFKLLSQVNLESLIKKYPSAKKDYYGYKFHNFKTNENYPIYLFPENANFELVAAIW